MKEENKAIRTGIIVNIFIAFIKLICGIIFKVNALLADSIFTFADLVTDIISMIGVKISKKKPDKFHPYGYGRVEYVTNSLIGIILLFVGVLTLIHSFTSEYEVPSLLSLIIVFLALLMKYILIKYYIEINKKLNSESVDENIEEGKLDLLSTGMVGFVIILGQFSKQVPILIYSDLIVCSIVSVMILKTGFDLLKPNVLNLLGTVEVNDELIRKIKTSINENNHVVVSKVELVKYGRYYKAHLVIKMNGDMPLKDAIEIKKKIILELKNRKDIIIRIVNLDYELDNVK